MQEKLLLNQARHADSDGSNTTLQVELSGNKDVIVDGAFHDAVNQYGVYLNEREACTKVRLTASVNMLASNVIFNSVTEIVKNEGSPDCMFLNYDYDKISIPSIGKNTNWGRDINYAVIDTQITYDGDNAKNYTYNCGIDIFNNPILRSSTMISQWYYSTDTPGYVDGNNFNTYNEFASDKYKVVATPHSMFKKDNTPKHQYRHTNDNTMTFFDSLNRNMIDNGGWIGFYNKSQSRSVVSSNPKYLSGYGTDRVINNESPGKFIDLFPGRDRYTMVPHYNKYRRRYEKNWEYCIAYPSSSTTENIPFINQELDTLRIGFIDETEKDDNGIYRCTIFSMVKHGLSEDDTINLYRTTEDGLKSELVEGDIVVDTVIDDYTFTVYTSDWVCKKWVSVFDAEECEYYRISHIISNQYYIVKDLERKMIELGYDFNTPKAQWRYVASKDKSYDITYNGDPWEKIENASGSTIEYSVNNYINVDYDGYGNGIVGHKYLPYNRVSRLIREIYDDTTDEQYESIERYFSENHEDFRIDATLGENSTWNVEPGCLERALESIRNCQTLSGITYSEGGVVYDTAMDTMIYMVERYYNNGEETSPSRYSAYYSGGTYGINFSFVSSKDTDGRSELLVDGIDFGYVFETDDQTEATTIGSKNLSFAKTVNGVQCKYYIRLFSRFPNFEFYDGIVDSDSIYSGETGSRPVDEYSKLEYERQSTVTKLGFAMNVYGDRLSQIVFNDDIDIDFVKDNLGRPITSLYLAFFKTNYGYRDWYQKINGNNPDYKAESAEWSRCFGKLNCGFEYSPYISEAYYISNSNKFANTHVMNNVHGVYGLNETQIGGGKAAHPDMSQYIDDDEIFYKDQEYFYGDLCEYSPVECMERSIQWPLHRFNTAQRELDIYSNNSSTFAYDKFNTVTYSVIGPTYSSLNTESNTTTYDYDDEPVKKPEGQVYMPYYEIPIRTLSEDINEFLPDLIGIISIRKDLDWQGKGSSYSATTSTEVQFNSGTTVCLFDMDEKVSYRCNLINILDLNKIKISVKEADLIDMDNVNRYRVFELRKGIPSYAEPIQGVDSAFKWRDIIQNGFETVDGIIDEYPFVNGCFYINKDINLFVRRQDPFGEYGLSSITKYYGIPSVTGEKNPVESGVSANANDAISEAAAIC